MNDKDVTISGHEDLDPDPYALQIIVKDTKDFTEKNLVETTARAVIFFLPEHSTMESGEAGENFEQWINGRFRKLLKRVKPNHFTKLITELEDNGIKHVTYAEGNVQLVVIEPVRKSFTLPALKRAQVSGLTVIENVLDRPVADLKHVQVTLNKDIGMSPSKAAVAAAHALQMLHKDDKTVLSLDLKAIWASIDKDTVDDEYDSVIRDAGLTEVETGSVTAAAKIIHND